MDMKTAFLYSIFEEEVYIAHSEGHNEFLPSVPNTKCSFMFHLQTYLYGLKQSLLAWDRKIDNFLTSIGFFPFQQNLNFYISIDIFIVL
jgi:hypothetical protein